MLFSQSRPGQRKFAARIFLALVPLLAMAPRMTAQAVAVAEIDGTVKDPTGQRIVDAQVKMTEVDKRQVHSAVTDNEGRYALPNLPVGAYVLEVSAPGFKTYIRSGITLQVSSTVQADVLMQVGSVSDSIQVTADASMLETKESSISEVIDQKRVVDLPLNGRNPTQLILLTGAATTTPVGDLTGSKNIQGSNGSGTFSVAGGQGNGLNFLLDGGDNNDPFSNVNLPLPFPDAMQEFSVQTNSTPAQYGLHPGGVVNSVTRSGSNAFHGDAFEFLRNGDFNARQEGTLTRDTLKRSQFGGVFGGRIIRDKLFFFGGYQGTRQRSTPPTVTSYVPTAAVLNGDFSVIDSAACVQKGAIQLKNPATGAPFPNNQIPTSLFDPAAVKLVSSYIPVSSDPCGKIQYGIPANNPDDQWIGRVDYVRSEKHTIFGRYYVYDYTAQATFDGKNALTTTTPGNQERSQTATIGDTYTFGAAMLNSFHATFARRRDDRGSAANLFSPTSLGVNMFNVLPNYIQLTISNYFNVACGTCAPGNFNTNTYQVSDDFNLIRGSHQLTFGVDVRRLQLNITNNQQANGQITFNGTATNDALADLLLGRMSQFVEGNPNPNALRQTVFAAYAQDAIRLTSRLRINLGVRWEPSFPPYDHYNRGDQFSLAAFNAGIHSTVYPTAPAGLLFAGDKQNKNGKDFYSKHWLSTSPRVGVVWDPSGDGRQTIRVGGALMHDTTELFYPERLTTNPPYASSVTLTNPAGPFSDPWRGQPGGNPFPGAAIFPLAGTYVNLASDIKPTYMIQWNVSYQRQIGKDWLASLDYIGNKTTHLLGSIDINPSVYIPGSTASTAKRRVLYLQNPTDGQYYGGIQQTDDGVNAHYNGMLASIQHRFASHYTLLANYTWSHCISDFDFVGELAGPLYQNPNDRRAERGNCGFDRRHNVNVSMVVTTPAIGNTLAKHLTGNWQLSPIFTAYSGQPFTVTDGGKDISLSAQLLDRPNVVLPNAVYPDNRTVKEWINPAAFAVQPTGTFGNEGHLALVGPGYWNLDLALSRLFRFNERFTLEARAESFNLFNHGNWVSPAGSGNTLSITSSTFGQITTFTSPRIIQLALKLAF